MNIKKVPIRSIIPKKSSLTESLDIFSTIGSDSALNDWIDEANSIRSMIQVEEKEHDDWMCENLTERRYRKYTENYIVEKRERKIQSLKNKYEENKKRHTEEKSFMKK